MPIASWIIYGPKAGTPEATAEDVPGLTNRYVTLVGDLKGGSVVFEGSDDDISWDTLATITRANDVPLAISKAYVRPRATLPAGAKTGVYLIKEGA